MTTKPLATGIAIAMLATTASAQDTTTIPTYVGDLTYQHQTLSRPSGIESRS